MAFYLLAIASAASIPGRMIPVYLSNRWTGPMNMMTLSVSLSSGVAFAWIGVKNVQGVIVFAIAYGFFVGAIVVVKAGHKKWG